MERKLTFRKDGAKKTDIAYLVIEVIEPNKMPGAHLTTHPKKRRNEENRGDHQAL